MGDLPQNSLPSRRLVVLACTEACLQGAWNLARFIKKEFGETVKYDLLTAPGGCYRLVHEAEQPRVLRDGGEGWEGVTEEYTPQPDDRSSVVLDDLGVLVGWCRSDTVVLVQHDGCRRYHAAMAFESSAAEYRVLVQDLKAAAQIIRGCFPKLHVLGYVAQIDAALGTTGLTKVHDSLDPALR